MKLISNCKKENNNFQSLKSWWDFGKILIKQLCQKYTLNVTKELSRSVHILEDEVMRLQHLTQTGNQDFIDDFKQKKVCFI